MACFSDFVTLEDFPRFGGVHQFCIIIEWMLARFSKSKDMKYCKTKVRSYHLDSFLGARLDILRQTRKQANKPGIVPTRRYGRIAIILCITLRLHNAERQ